MPAWWHRATASGNLRPRRVEQADQSEQAEIVLGVLAERGRLGAVRQAPSRDREDAQPLRRVALEHREHRVAGGVVQRHVIVGAADHRRAFEHLLRRTLGVDGQAAVLALVDRRHQTQRRVEPEQPPPLVLAARNGDVDAELAHRFEHPHLGRLAARLSRPLRGELGARARGGGTAEEAEDGIGGDRRRGRSVALEVDLAERRPHARGAHPVLGQGARLVGADDGRRAERLDRREPLDERALPGELGHPDGERERDRRQQPLGDVGDDQTDREAGGIVQRESGERASRSAGTQAPR